ncbi:hypothetical protein FRB94_010674 [Tulasnella sp. JGI-2019a]|nr:hypothetical protein FRB94_010674 [Tulasnella sp. JGI-2019a]KAG9011302.1 hypothetical protein FRB93_003104 [Tulasnella sp. JGI-2019a]
MPAQSSNVELKRKAIPVENQGLPSAKRARKIVDSGEDSIPDDPNESNPPEWPTSPTALNTARSFLKRCASESGTKTLIIPDKDADGLCGGSIIYRTLLLLGHPPELLKVHVLAKGSNVHEVSERQAIAMYETKFIVVVDQGSRGQPVLLDGDDDTEVLIIDHHLSDEFPPRATVLSACHHEPVATSALLSYILCSPLHEAITSSCDWLACMGTIGDLGTSFKWERPFPDMKECFKKYTKKAMSEAVSLINAPRRTAKYDVISAWTALDAASCPQDVLSSKSPHVQRLLDARHQVNLEVERCSHSAPQFSSDGKVTLLRITSKAQVHPVVATRWAGSLKSKALEVVMVANDGYLPGKVNFSCRVARCAHARPTPTPNIIDLLRFYAERPLPFALASSPSTLETSNLKEPSRKTLRERLGDNFARGHKQASGGIVDTQEFEELCQAMEIGVKKDDAPRSSSKKKGMVQKNTLDRYFGGPSKA